MTKDEFDNFCLSFNGVTKSYPFEDDDETLAYNVMDEYFAFTKIEDYEGINLKCDPVKAAMLRDLYQEVESGDHKEKRYWNKVVPDGELDDELIKEWIKDSYNLVVDGLARKKQKKLEKMEDD